MEVAFGDKRLPERFWNKIAIMDVGACWLWTSCRLPGSYGQFRWQGKAQLAHRVAYSELVGPIPEGLDLDHVVARGCIARHCVNPAHLEPVTRAVNLSRERMTPAGLAVKIEVARATGLVTGKLTGPTNLLKATAKRKAQTHCKRGHELSGDNLYINPPKMARNCRACKISRKEEKERATSGK